MSDDRQRNDEPSTDGASAVSNPLLRTDSVTKRFGKLTAVSDVSLSIPEGGISSIIGPNGAGKTTLFNLFTGKHAPTEGSIEFRDEEIGGLAPHEIVSRGIVRSYQITNFFSDLSALENVRLATQADRTGFGPDDFMRHHASLSDATDEAEAVLDRIGLLDVADQTAANLAYGQRRHLEIGIALATDPDLLLMDEPTAGMGAEQTNATVSLIEDIAEDATVVLIEHDMDIVMNVSERIAVMNKGELIARGTPDEISRNEAVQRAYLGGE